jgi:hypothetical protein
MSYAIAKVIFGIPLGVDETNLILIELIEEAVANNDRGFLSYYSASGDEPRAFGVEIDTFDECCSSVDVSSIRWTPTESQRREFYQLWEHVDDEFKILIEKECGYPRSIILWTTS